ncbi:hypothetical protein LBMAG56_45010 [Verrucomicrobiota bacterium]|nr:hypothetical protein LBMAG56_45010 [Verrucomicrobiota bacterium]
MTPSLVLWIYIVLLIVGGLIGFLKAGSKASLIASVICAIPLIICNVVAGLPPWLADVFVAVLLVYFGMKFAKGRKFMPAGFMTILSVITLILRQVLK